MDKRISDLNSVTTPTNSDLLAIVNNNETKKITYGNLYDGIRDGVVESSYISLYSTSSQSLAQSGSEQVVTFTSVWADQGISLVDGTKMTMDSQGTYQFNFVAQLSNSDNAVHDGYFWIKYNGVNFPNSTTRMTLQPRKSSTESSAQLMTMNIVGQNIVDNGYIELWWTGDSTSLSLEESPAFGPVPETPSIIADIIRVG